MGDVRRARQLRGVFCHQQLLGTRGERRCRRPSWGGTRHQLLSPWFNLIGTRLAPGCKTGWRTKTNSLDARIARRRSITSYPAAAKRPKGRTLSAR